MSKGMIYPEILDRREYKVGYGESPSIDRVHATAVTIDDTLCECTEIDWVKRLTNVAKINHARGSDRSVPYHLRSMIDCFNVAKYQSDNQYDKFQEGEWINITKKENHARNLRKLVMYEEMFELPVMVGVKSIRKDVLQRAYNTHRIYMATYNKVNRGRRKAHEKEMAKRKAKGQYYWNYSGQYLRYEIDKFGIICPDLMLDMIFRCMSQKDIPYAELGQFISLFTYADAQNFNHMISKVKDLVLYLDDDVLDKADNLWAIMDTHEEEGLTEFSMLFTGKVDKLSRIIDGINSNNTSLFGSSSEDVLGQNELNRRLSNLYKISTIQQQIMYRIYPAKWYSNNLTPKRKQVKRLALFYQFLMEGKVTKLKDQMNLNLAPHEAKVQDKLSNSKVMTKESRKYKELDSSIMQMIDQAIEGGTPSGKAPERTDKLPQTKTRWARTQFVTGKLTSDLANKLKARRYRPSDVGAVPKYMNRWATDKYVWANKRSMKGGTIAIDCSGSMNFSNEDIDNILKSLPAVKIVGYAGNRASDDGEVEGYIEVFAEKQRRVTNIYTDTAIYKHRFGNNLVDVPAILWLARQPQPRILISDMQIVGILQKLDNKTKQYHDCGYDTTEEIMDFCYDLCKKHKITILEDIEAMVEYAKGVTTK